MGGEGGGVLADWIVDLGEHNGYLAQTTSVPGVAQRTGATIYYVELYPQKQAEQDGGTPVLALMPLPGDVDVVLASELMEAGRAVQRGLVTPDRTTLIASTHRVYAISEKSAMGDGRVDDAELLKHAEAAAKALRPLRHGRRRRGVGQRDQRGAVRRARRHRRAAVQPCAVRGDDRAWRRRREAEPEGLRRGLRACRRHRHAVSSEPGVDASLAAPPWRRSTARPMRRSLRRPSRTGIDAARSEGSFTARPRAQRLPGRSARDADRGRAPHDRLPGSGLRRALPRPHGASSMPTAADRRARELLSTRPRATSRCG